jgi:hypothetical protein
MCVHINVIDTLWAQFKIPGESLFVALQLICGLYYVYMDPEASLWFGI